jgi:hypothetical protein
MRASTVSLMIVQAFLFAIPLNSAHAQGTSPELGSDDAFLHGSSDALISMLKLRKPSNVDALEQQIAATVRALDTEAGLTTSVWICHGCGLSSHPTLGILADVDQLAKIRSQFQVQQFSAILTLIMAHEEAHLIQYRQYSPSIVDSSEQDRRVYEAQADLLAGAYFIENIGAWSDQNRDAVLEALQVAYDLGVEQYALADHPTQISRLTAVRFGMSAGTRDGLMKLGGPPAKASADILTHKLNIRPNEDTLSWSLRISKGITSYRRPEVVDLVLTREQMSWNKSGVNPTVTYLLTYENRGKRNIQVYLQVRCDGVPRNNPHDVMHSLLIDASASSFSLAPGATKTLSGTMQWAGGATSDLMPRLVYAPDPAALVEVTYAVPPPTNPPASQVVALAETTAASRRSFEYALKTILMSSFDDYRPLRAGPGKQEGDEVVYPADPQLPGSASTTVWMPEPGAVLGPYVRADFPTTTDQAIANDNYNREVRAMHSLLQSLGTWDERASRSHDGARISTDFGQGGIGISVEDYFSDGSYTVSVRVSGKKDFEQSQ